MDLGRHWLQVDLQIWDELPNRRSVGMLRQSIQDPPFDGLDFVVADGNDRFAVVRLPSGAMVLFTEIFGSPVAGTHLWISGDIDATEEVLEELFQCFNLRQDDLVWRHDA